ncbi:head-tail joining protein [Cupriavidus sp. SS-3]|uniref:head-tail joining protein n=1 Tax=Cupriavidus sp. SS-3 TaxID=3109596 RepID=UPI002DBC80EE|nr:hypothetical protein [Cupriavidus sp. SS-3]MEC3765007.1 hypothetical protein [Cupriavidus sp. SS-3]
MGFDPAVFWSAFRSAGMLTTASWSGGPDFDVGFEEPETLMVEGSLHVAERSIEYQTHDAPTLRRDDVVTIDGKRYRLSQTPQKQGDGFFSRAVLETAP